MRPLPRSEAVEKLTEDNVVLYAARCYDNPQCRGLDEFREDMRRFRYVKKLLTRYVETGELKRELILNHLIVLNNVFPPPHLARILFLKLEPQMRYLKPFLVLLNVLPESVHGIGRDGATLYTDDYPMDPGIVAALRGI